MEQATIIKLDFTNNAEILKQGLRVLNLSCDKHGTTYTANRLLQRSSQRVAQWKYRNKISIEAAVAIIWILGGDHNVRFIK